MLMTNDSSQQRASVSPRNDIADTDRGISFYGIPKFSLQGKNASLKLVRTYTQIKLNFSFVVHRFPVVIFHFL